MSVGRSGGRAGPLLRGVVLAMVLGGVLTGCLSRSTSPGGDATPSVDLIPSRTATVDKVLMFVVENHSLRQMREQMPFTVSLGETYGYATGYQAIRHPSLPNYLAIAGGDTFGVTDDHPPADHRLHGQSIFGQALATGATAAVYAEAMPGACTQENTGTYAVRHNPWAYFVDEADACALHDQPLDRLAGDVAAGRLPTVGLVVPDLCHDAHDCGLGTADAWLKEQVDRVMTGPDWASGHLMVVITADEDDHHQDNTVLTTVALPALHGVVADSPLNHYSLTRLVGEVLGVEPLRGGAAAPSLTEAFGLRLSGRG